MAIEIYFCDINGNVYSICENSTIDPDIVYLKYQPDNGQIIESKFSNVKVNDVFINLQKRPADLSTRFDDSYNYNRVLIYICVTTNIKRQGCMKTVKESIDTLYHLFSKLNKNERVYIHYNPKFTGMHVFEHVDVLTYLEIFNSIIPEHMSNLVEICAY